MDAELKVVVARLEGKLEGHNDLVNQKLDVLIERGVDHEERLRKLERVRNLAGGGLAVVVSVWGAFKSGFLNIS